MLIVEEKTYYGRLTGEFENQVIPNQFTPAEMDAVARKAASKMSYDVYDVNAGYYPHMLKNKIDVSLRPAVASDVEVLKMDYARAAARGDMAKADKLKREMFRVYRTSGLRPSEVGKQRVMATRQHPQYRDLTENYAIDFVSPHKEELERVVLMEKAKIAKAQAAKKVPQCDVIDVMYIVLCVCVYLLCCIYTYVCQLEEDIERAGGYFRYQQLQEAYAKRAAEEKIAADALEKSRLKIQAATQVVCFGLLFEMCVWLFFFTSLSCSARALSKKSTPNSQRLRYVVIV
jgi:hypothetical protein